MLKTKMRPYFSWSRLLAFFGLVGLIVASLQYPIFSQSLTTGYNSDSNLQRGMIVQLKKDDTTKVEPATIETAEETFGVVVSPNDSAVTVSQDGQHFFVAKVGKYDVLVDDQNGEIQPGDFLTVSAASGVGMKASDREPVVIGRALSAFNGKDGVVSTIKIKDGSGAEKELRVGRVQADITVAKNPLLRADEPNVPEFLKKASVAIAGKEVSPVRIYLAVIIFCISAIIALGLMYGGIRSAIISIGRNPLSKKSIIRGMAQVIVSGLIIFISGLFGVYLMLRL